MPLPQSHYITISDLQRVRLMITIFHDLQSVPDDEKLTVGRILSKWTDKLYSALPELTEDPENLQEQKPINTSDTNFEPVPARAGSAPVVKQFVECPSCGKIWPYDGHAADVCCGGCSHNFHVPPDAMLRRLHECESVLRSVVKNLPIMVAGFRGTLLHSNCVRLVGEPNDQTLPTEGAAQDS